MFIDWLVELKIRFGVVVKLVLNWVWVLFSFFCYRMWVCGVMCLFLWFLKVLNSCRLVFMWMFFRLLLWLVRVLVFCFLLKWMLDR